MRSCEAAVVVVIQCLRVIDRRVAGGGSLHSKRSAQIRLRCGADGRALPHWTVTTAVAVLLAVFGSATELVTLTVLLVVPFLCGDLTTSVTVALALLFSVPMEQFSVEFPLALEIEQVPCVVDDET